ncbi:MAG TPA: hypothetical protein VI039_13025 [Solirubrobacterales bacterium]
MAASPTLPDAEILEAADDGRLVDLAMYRALQGSALEIDHDNPPIDEVACERAEEEIAELHGRVSEAESILRWLAGFLGEGNLGIAAVNSAGIKLGEVREQLPVMRQAVRNLERCS